MLAGISPDSISMLHEGKLRHALAPFPHSHLLSASSLKFVTTKATFRRALILRVFPPSTSYTTTCGFKTKGAVEEDFEEF